MRELHRFVLWCFLTGSAMVVVGLVRVPSVVAVLMGSWAGIVAFKVFERDERGLMETVKAGHVLVMDVGARVSIGELARISPVGKLRVLTGYNPYTWHTIRTDEIHRIISLANYAHLVQKILLLVARRGWELKLIDAETLFEVVRELPREMTELGHRVKRQRPGILATLVEESLTDEGLQLEPHHERRNEVDMKQPIELGEEDKLFFVKAAEGEEEVRRLVFSREQAILAFAARGNTILSIHYLVEQGTVKLVPLKIVFLDGRLQLTEDVKRREEIEEEG